MRRIFLYLFFIVLSVGSISTGGVLRALSPETGSTSVAVMGRQLYEEMRLDQWVCFDAFMQGLRGSEKIDRKNKDILTLIDFSKPSTAERMVVLDIRQKRILYTSLVSHGKNSGGNYATSFSNENGSHKSSLGFYLTENTYQGRNGYSLILNGLEKGINDLAKQRAIVIHGASYSDPSVAASSGRLGRSFGCPALPVSVSKPIINTIKNGTLLFIYANDKNYLTQSSILSTQQENDIFHEKGQIYFRDLEREVILQESLKNDCVIATGGGSILDNENIKRLKETSFIVFLNATIKCLYLRLKDSTTRPILNDAVDKRKLIEELLEKRKFLYQMSADHIIDINEYTNIYETVDKIKEAYIIS